MKRQNIFILLFFGIIALIPTWKYIFSNQVPVLVEDIHTLTPWMQGTPVDHLDVLYADSALQFLPWRDLMLESMRGGEIPLWNPYTLGGIPFLANSQSAPLYPVHWMFSLTGLNAESLLIFSAWLHLFIAGLGMFYLCRALGGSLLGGVLGGSAFALSAFMVSWVPLPSVMMTASWIPWCLFALLHLSNQIGFKQISLSAIPFGMMLLSGHLQIAMYGLLAILFLVLWLLIISRKRTLFFISALLSVALGAGLASPQLLPSIENGFDGHRSSPPTVEGYKGYERQALQLHHYSVLLAPTIFGLPSHTFTGETGGEIPSYWLAIEEPGRHYAELAFYVGPVVLFLAIVSIFFQPYDYRRFYFLGLIVFAFVASLGTFVTKFMYFYIPGWASTGSPGRIAILLTIGLCVLAGTAHKETDDHKIQNSGKLGTYLSVIILALSIAFVFRWAHQFEFDIQAEMFAKSVPFLGASLAGVILSLTLLWKNSLSQHALISCLILSCLGLIAVHHGILPASEKGLCKQDFEYLENLKNADLIAVMNSSEDWTLYGPLLSMSAPPNSLLPYRINELTGYDSIIPKKRKQRVDAINKRDSAPLANGNMVFIKPACDFQALAETGVQFILTTEQLEFPLAYFKDEYKVYTLPPPARHPPKTKSRTFNTAVKIWEEDNLPALESDCKGWYVQTAGGWQELTPEFQASGEVQMKYYPDSYRLGMLLGLTCIFVISAISFIKSSTSETNEKSTFTDSR